MGLMDGARWVGDSLQNFVTGRGIFGRDKGASGVHVFRRLTDQDLEAAYRGNWIAAKIVDIPAFDMVRAWRNWQAEKDQITAIEAEEKRLNVVGKVQWALTLGRLYGGAALVMDDGRSLASPLKVTAKGQLRALIPVRKDRLRAGPMQWDPTQPDYDTPKMFIMDTRGGRGSIDVHPSRVIRFIGKPIPNPDLEGGEGRIWGDSVLQSLMDDVNRATQTSQAIAALVEEAKVDVVKIPGLMQQIGTAEYRQRLEARWELAAVLKSLEGVLLIDGLEDYERKQTTLTGVVDVVNAFMQIVSGAADMPAARFLSQSPGGLNASGDADIRNHYDMISARQRIDLAPRLFGLDDALLVSALGTPDDAIHYNWAPLWQLGPVEAADAFNKRAVGHKAYADAGLLPITAHTAALINDLTERGDLPGLEQAVDDLEKGILEPIEDPAEEAEQERELALAEGQAKIEKKYAPPVKKAANDARLQDTTPRPLYVRRDLLNVRQFRAWAKSQGFEGLVDQLHVTLVYSPTPVDWMLMGNDWSGDENGNVNVPAGGPRVVEPLGPNGAIVLHFAFDGFDWRHRRLIEAGAVSTYPGEYHPHVTITHDGADVDLATVEPFRGPLKFGPEYFDEAKDVTPGAR